MLSEQFVKVLSSESPCDFRNGHNIPPGIENARPRVSDQWGRSHLPGSILKSVNSLKGFNLRRQSRCMFEKMPEQDFFSAFLVGAGGPFGKDSKYWGIQRELLSSHQDCCQCGDVGSWNILLEVWSILVARIDHYMVC